MPLYVYSTPFWKVPKVHPLGKYVIIIVGLFPINKSYLGNLLLVYDSKTNLQILHIWYGIKLPNLDEYIQIVMNFMVIIHMWLHHSSDHSLKVWIYNINKIIGFHVNSWIFFSKKQGT